MANKVKCSMCRGKLVPATEDKVRCVDCGALQPKPVKRDIVHRVIPQFSTDTPWKVKDN